MLTINATDLPRFMQCNGMINLPNLNISTGDNAARKEGDAAHYMAQCVINRKQTIEELADRKAPNGVYMTAEMADHVNEFIDAIQARGDATGLMESVANFNGENWQVNCRLDYGFYDGNTLYIDDLKYGWSLVEPFDNWTLLAYAIGYCLTHGIAPRCIVMTIHQPRPYHPDGGQRSWEIDYVTLTEYYARISSAMANPSNQLQTGSECKNCPSLTFCPAARKAGMNAIDASERTFTDDISNSILAYELDTIYRAESALKNRREALEELAKHKLKNGEIIENFAVEIQLANRRWKDDIDYKLLEVMTGINLHTEKVVTPPEAKRRGVSDDMISAFAHRPQTGLKLVRISANKRAERIFGKKN